MTHSNTPWPAYDWTGKIVVITCSHSAGRHRVQTLRKRDLAEHPMGEATLWLI